MSIRLRVRRLLWRTFCTVERFEVGDGTANLLFSWGEPRVVFCTHMDTVPPYIPPTFDEALGTMSGRGTCDAKGQIYAMYEACRILESKGYDGFGLQKHSENNIRVPSGWLWASRLTTVWRQPAREPRPLK